jgi:hypothetical protein
MIYVIRRQNGRETLVELSSKSALIADGWPNRTSDKWVSRQEAHRWVLDGKEHETGLFIDGGKVRYAKAEG